MMNANATAEGRTYDPVAFHLTGRRTGGAPDAAAGACPALLAPYRKLD